MVEKPGEAAKGAHAEGVEKLCKGEDTAEKQHTVEKSLKAAKGAHAEAVEKQHRVDVIPLLKFTRCDNGEGRSNWNSNI